MSAWVELLGGGGIVAALGMIGATFVRVGRVMQRLDDLGERMIRVERWQDGVDAFGRSLIEPQRPVWRGRPVR